MTQQQQFLQNIFNKDALIAWFFDTGLQILIIIGAALFLNYVGRKYLNKFLHRVIKYEEQGDKKREDTVVKIINWIFSIVLWGITFITILGFIGVNVTGVLAGAGVVGLAVGFGAQYMIRDFLAGIFVIIENQYRVGDVVCLDNTCGLVEDITLRKTVLRDLDGKEHHITHGSVKIISNLSKEFARVNINVPITYDSNLERAIEILNKIGNEMASDPVFGEQIIKPPQVLGVDAFSDIGVEIKVVGDTKPLKQWGVARELRKRIKVAFDKEGIKMPKRIIHI